MRERSSFEIAGIIEQFGEQFIEKCKPNAFILRTLDALNKCRTSALGGHKDKCNCCGKERLSYNSCGNRHCPKCQATKQALWAEDRMNDALDVKYFHLVFTVPDKLNEICMLDSKLFYSLLFELCMEHATNIRIHSLWPRKRCNMCITYLGPKFKFASAYPLHRSGGGTFP